MQKIAKRAIDAALQGNWQEAADLNLQIIQNSPKDKSAMNRLAKAYIQLEKWNDAKKILKEVLDLDPIDQVAKKNLRIANNHIKVEGENGKVTAEDFVKEPGTSLEIDVEIKGSHTIDDYTIGEVLILKPSKDTIEVICDKTNDNIGVIENEKLSNTIKLAKKDQVSISATLVGGKGKTVEVLIKADKPIFKSQKQDVRPYVKKGAIEEPTIDIPENEMTNIE